MASGITISKRENDAEVLSPSNALCGESQIPTIAVSTEERPVTEGSPYSRQTLYKRADVARALRWYMATDVLGLVLAFFCAWSVAQAINIHVLGRPEGLQNSVFDAFHVTQFVLLAAGIILWFENAGHYSVRTNARTEARRVAGALCFAMLVDGFIVFAAKEDVSRLWLMLGWMLAVPVILALREIYRTLQRRFGAWQIRAMLVGNGRAAEDALKVIRSHKALGYEVKAHVKDVNEAFAKAGESWENLCAVYGVDHIVIALDGADMAKAELPLAQLMREKVPFSIAPPLRRLAACGVLPHYFFNHDILLMTRV